MVIKSVTETGSDRFAEALNGRNAVITGGASGIGFGMAEAFLARGANVALVDINDDALAQACTELNLGAERVITIRADVGDPVAVERAKDLCLAAFDRVDIVCANAGHGSREIPIWEMPLEEWQWVFDANVVGVINMARAFLPAMVERDSGHFVITASMQGITTGRVGPYAASKHAASSIAETTFADLRRVGSAVGVSCLCPSYTKNSMVDHPERLRRFLDTELTETDLQAQAEVARKLSENGLEARDVGDMVADAVLTDRFWIIPMPGSLDRVQQRVDEIVQGRAPSIATT